MNPARFTTATIVQVLPARRRVVLDEVLRLDVLDDLARRIVIGAAVLAPE